MHQTNHQLKVTNQFPKARFAMSRLEYGKSEVPAGPLSAPPYEFSESADSCNIYFNMFGIPESKIRTGFDDKANRFTIFAERENPKFTDQYLWVFSLPTDVNLNSVQTFYKNGAIQFTFPKQMAA